MYIEESKKGEGAVTHVNPRHTLTFGKSPCISRYSMGFQILTYAHCNNLLHQTVNIMLLRNSASLSILLSILIEKSFSRPIVQL